MNFPYFPLISRAPSFSHPEWWSFFVEVTKALDSVAIFATEWGTCDASGDGTLNLEEARSQELWLWGPETAG